MNVLLATSLIEVGVDVPNATVMLIENAEQFGLAQLHQLRGRIGRGAADSYCILVAAAKTAEARQRLRVLEETTDGFRIAEADLKLRGPGELLGPQQSGMPRFRFGDSGGGLGSDPAGARHGGAARCAWLRRAEQAHRSNSLFLTGKRPSGPNRSVIRIGWINFLATAQASYMG